MPFRARIAPLPKALPVKPKALALAITLASLALFGDTLLPWLGHFALLLLEVVEISLEHLLEHVFGLSPRGAQTVLAWSALFLAIYLAIWLVRKTVRFVRSALAALTVQWRNLHEYLESTWLARPWLIGAVLVAAMGTGLLLFS